MSVKDDFAYTAEGLSIEYLEMSREDHIDVFAEFERDARLEVLDRLRDIDPTPLRVQTAKQALQAECEDVISELNEYLANPSESSGVVSRFDETSEKERELTWAYAIDTDIDTFGGGSKWRVRPKDRLNISEDEMAKDERIPLRRADVDELWFKLGKSAHGTQSRFQLWNAASDLLIANDLTDDRSGDRKRELARRASGDRYGKDRYRL